MHAACVCQCANGMSARAAWEATGRPEGEKSIQNIRKRGRLLAAKSQTSVAAISPIAAREESDEQAEPAPVSSKKKEIFRLTSAQVCKKRADADTCKAEYDRLYRAATN